MGALPHATGLGGIHTSRRLARCSLAPPGHFVPLFRETPIDEAAIGLFRLTVARERVPQPGEESPHRPARRADGGPTSCRADHRAPTAPAAAPIPAPTAVPPATSPARPAPGSAPAASADFLHSTMSHPADSRPTVLKWKLG
jgi:hypothetical protein